MSHTAKYKNGVTLPEVTSIWAHVFQPRQFQGKGDFRYDVSLILTNEQMLALHEEAGALALEAFPNGEYSQAGFAYPYSPVETKANSPKLAEVFPGHFIISAKAYEDNPPEILIPHEGSYVPMPEASRAQLVFDGAKVYAGISLASYHTGTNFGIRAQLDWIIFYGAGEKVVVGSRPDAKSQLAAKGINVAMQLPAGGMPTGQGAAAPAPVTPAQAAPPAGVAPAPQGQVAPAPAQQAVAPAQATAPAPAQAAAPQTPVAPAPAQAAPVPPINYEG